jgi:excisionase family DNA binding protein
MQNELPELLTVADFVARYRVSRTATYRLFTSGALRAKKVGRRTMIARSDADRWVSSLPPAIPRAA